MKKFILPAMLAVVMAFTLCLVGCGSDSDSSASDSSSAESSSSAADSSSSDSSSADSADAESDDESCCSDSGVTLDKSVTLAGLTCKMPSDWKESNSLEEDGFGEIDYSQDDGTSGILLSYQNSDLDETPAELVESLSDSFKEDEANSNVDYGEVRSTEISGYTCDVYSVTYTTKIDGQDNDCEQYYAFITTPSTRYEISTFAPVGNYGGSSLLDDILSTVSIEE